MIKLLAGILYLIILINAQRQVVGLKICINILKENLKYLDLSSIELGGSYTPAKKGEDAVGYQGRKDVNIITRFSYLITKELYCKCSLCK